MVELLLLAAALSADNFVSKHRIWKQQYENFTRHDGAAESVLQCCPGCFRAVWKKISAVRRTGMGNQSGCGLLFSYGNAENFRRTEKTQKKKSRENQKQDWNIWKKQLHPLEFGLLAVSMSVDGIVSGVFAADLR